MRRKLKVALIQFAPLSYEREQNLNKSLIFTQTALEQGAKLVVLPELFDSGYCVEDKDFSYALSLEKELPSSLKELAKKYEAYIIACSIEKEDDILYDTAFIVGKEGLVGKYRKIYLFRDEKKRFARGQDYPVFELVFKDFSLKLGLQICYEIGFGEGARFLALQGAELICYPSAFGKARAYVWDLASRARALESGAFVLAANRCGSEISKLSGENLEFAGRSKIINPKGEILSELSEKEDISYAVLDITQVKAQREYLTYLKDLDLDLSQKMYAKFNLS